MDFRTVIGQEQAIEFLQGALISGRLAPAYLFAGAPGTGRNLTANCFTLSLLSRHQSADKKQLIIERILEQNYPDLMVVEPTYQHQGKLFTAAQAKEAGVKRRALPQIRLDQIREVCQFLNRPPRESSNSIVIIQEAETMTEGAANALLKTLEEPGLGIFILIAKSLDSVLPTLSSRCQYIPFSRLSESQMKNILQLKGYGDMLQYEDIVALGQGSPGEAIEAYSQYQAISIDLRLKLNEIPKNPLEALKLARDIDQELDVETQLWLVGYLQQKYWEKSRYRMSIVLLEETRRYLLCYVQPRLVWENLYLKLLSS